MDQLQQDEEKSISKDGPVKKRKTAKIALPSSDHIKIPRDSEEEAK